MKRLISVGLVLAIIIGLGVVLNAIGQGGQLPGVRPQTTNPNASTLVMTPEQGVWLLIWTVFVTLGPLVTFAAFLTFLMWWGNRQVMRARTEAKQPLEFSLNPAKPRTLGYVLVRSPRLVIGLVIFVLIGSAVFLALLGAFTPR
ncbi:MAG: hypothetical protein RML95_08885 [Anaerolineae bacterium]|nr:hypothetical protein [Anaerolineae bacterium]MDW8299442.1 hypothetical protein [Anaerolineae bacterium]